MADEPLQEPAAQTSRDDDTAISEGLVHDVAVSILGAAGWDGIRAASRYAIDRYRTGSEPPEDSPGFIDTWDEVNDLTAEVDPIDFTVEGDWTRPINFNDFDA